MAGTGCARQKAVQGTGCARLGGNPFANTTRLILLHSLFLSPLPLREPVRKKYGIFWEFFPYGEGGGVPKSQNFCDLTK